MRLRANTNVRNISILIVRQAFSACSQLFFTRKLRTMAQKKSGEKGGNERRTRSCAHSISVHNNFPCDHVCPITGYFFAYLIFLYASLLMGFLFSPFRRGIRKVVVNGHWMRLINKSLIASATRLDGFLVSKTLRDVIDISSHYHNQTNLNQIDTENEF